MSNLRHRLLELVRARFADRPLPLQLVFWDGDSFEFSPSPSVTLTLKSPAIVRYLWSGDFARLGDAFVEGTIEVDGRIDDVLEIGISLAERLGRIKSVNYVAGLGKLLPRSHSRRRDAANIGYHYDLGNEFYRLWLDDLMVYSCAYFRTGSEDINAAQQQKLDHICRKLLLKPGETLLDIGCGWGGLLGWAATHYGINGVGITLSKHQYGFAQTSLREAGLADRIEIRLQHYGDLDESERFDKIVSVGMYEHVGLSRLPEYFRKIAALLRPGGAVLNHGIFATDASGSPRGPAGGEFIDRYVFPGGAVPHLSRVLIELARVGLEFADAEDLRPHYALTLRHWSQRLERHREQAVQLAGERNVRIWRMFLAGMAHAFDRGWLSIAQVLAFKPSRDGTVRRPWTRDYQYRDVGDCAGEVPSAGRLDRTSH